MGVMTDPFIAGRGDPISAGGSPNAYADEESACLCRASGKSARRASAMPMPRLKAPPMRLTFEQRWSVWGAGFGGSQTHRRQHGARLATTRAAASMAARPAPTIACRRTRWRALRWPAAAPISASTALAAAARTCSRPARFIRHNVGAGLYHRRAGLWLAGHHDRPHGDGRRHRPAARAVQRQCMVRPPRRRLSLCRHGFGWTPVRGRTVHDVRAAGLCGAGDRPAPTPLRSPTTQRASPPRSELGLRTDKSFAMQDGIFTLRGRAAWAHNFNTDRTIGADLPDAARRRLRRQRRGAGAPTRRWSPARPK